MIKKKTIYYDGSCNFCTTIKNKIESSSHSEEFDCIDITKNNLLHNLPKKQLMEQIHVVDENGNIYKNIDAILKVLDSYPEFKILNKLGRILIIKQLLSLIYKFISSNR